MPTSSRELKTTVVHFGEKFCCLRTFRLKGTLMVSLYDLAIMVGNGKVHSENQAIKGLPDSKLCYLQGANDMEAFVDSQWSIKSIGMFEEVADIIKKDKIMKDLKTFLTGIDWELLREQKSWLLRRTSEESRRLLHLVDDLQAAAAEELGEDVVFELATEVAKNERKEESTWILYYSHSGDLEDEPYGVVIGSEDFAKAESKKALSEYVEGHSEITYDEERELCVKIVRVYGPTVMEVKNGSR